MVAGANLRTVGVEMATPTYSNIQGYCLLMPSQERGSMSSLFRHVLDGLVLLHGFLPVAAIEFLSDHTPHSAFIEAVGGNS